MNPYEPKEASGEGRRLLLRSADDRVLLETARSPDVDKKLLLSADAAVCFLHIKNGGSLFY